jgi:hypothetical protein
MPSLTDTREVNGTGEGTRVNVGITVGGRFVGVRSATVIAAVGLVTGGTGVIPVPQAERKIKKRNPDFFMMF